MAKILLAEDDGSMSQLIVDCLRVDLHTVDVVADGQEALSRLKLYGYDLAVLDWGLPGTTGPEVCRKYRDQGGKIPILMLTARASIDDKETGFMSGADDYLTKDFDARELRLRVQALLRRPSTMITEVSLANVRLLQNKQAVMIGETEVELLSREYCLLEFLLRHPDQIHSQESLLNRVWPSESDSTFLALRSCVARLRRKIQLPNCQCEISAHYGRGYSIQKKSD